MLIKELLFLFSSYSFQLSILKFTLNFMSINSTFHYILFKKSLSLYLKCWLLHVFLNVNLLNDYDLIWIFGILIQNVLFKWQFIIAIEFFHLLDLLLFFKIDFFDFQIFISLDLIIWIKFSIFYIFLSSSDITNLSLILDHFSIIALIIID